MMRKTADVELGAAQKLKSQEERSLEKPRRKSQRKTVQTWEAQKRANLVELEKCFNIESKFQMRGLL